MWHNIASLASDKMNPPMFVAWRVLPAEYAYEDVSTSHDIPLHMTASTQERSPPFCQQDR